MITNDNKFMLLAIDQARLGLTEGGVPIGAVLVVDNKVLATGHNQRVQLGSAIRHAEMDCLENAGRLPAVTYQKATLYTTLSPCPMCSGAVLLYKIPRVVIGENQTFHGSEDLLKANGVQLINLELDDCQQMMWDYEVANPTVWHEDIGESS